MAIRSLLWRLYERDQVLFLLIIIGFGFLTIKVTEFDAVTTKKQQLYDDKKVLAL